MPFAPDREHLRRMSDIMRLMQSEVANHRQLELLRHNRRIATLTTKSPLCDFRENDDRVATGVETEADIEALLKKQGLLGLALEYRAAAEAIDPNAERQFAGVFANFQQVIADLFRGDFAQAGEFSLRESIADPQGLPLPLDFPIQEGGAV